ncbi:MFS transporter [Nocardia sp. NPDC055321]
MPALMLLRRRRILLVWLTQLLSVMGDRFFALAIMWVALERSGPVVMGAVAIAESVPYVLVGLFGQRLVALAARLSALAGLELVRAVLTVTLVAAWAGAGTIAMLAMVTVLGICGALFDPGLGALVPDLVGESERPRLVALMDLTGRIARVAGPATAGLLLMLAPLPVLFVMDAATFAVSAAAMAWLARTATRASVPGAGPSTPTPTRPARARALLHASPSLTIAFAVHGTGFFCNALPAIGLPLLLVQFTAGPAQYGWMLTGAGIAAVAGNMVASRARPETGFPGRLCAGWAATGVLLVATGVAPSVGWVVAAAVLAGFASPFIGIALGVHLAGFATADRVPMLSVQYSVMRGAGTLGMAVVPASIASDPARGFIVGGAILVGVATLGWWLSGRLDQ